MPNVLVVDDDDLYREYLMTLLTRHGYRVHGLRNRGALASMIGAVRFDAVITDLFMPEVDGIEILLTVKRLTPSLPVIGITGGFDSQGDLSCNSAMTKLGAEAVLIKPLDAAALLKVLKQALDREACPFAEMSKRAMASHR